MTIPLLTFAPDPPPGALAVDLGQMISAGNGLLIAGTSGSGKSHALRGILEQTADRLQQIVIDLEGEFATLRAQFPYLLAAVSGGDVPLSIGRAAPLAQRIMQTGVSAILDIHDLKPAERIGFVKLFLEELIETPVENRRPCLVVIDEAHRFAPQSGKVDSKDAVVDITARGRKRGLIPLFATQRISKLDKDAAAELLSKLTGFITLDVDVDRAADELGLRGEQAARLRDLHRGQFFASGPLFGRTVTLCHTGQNLTEPPRLGAGTGGGSAPEQITEVLGKFADMPTETEAEPTTLAQAKKTIAELRRKLREGPQAQAEAAGPSTEKRTETVYLPVLTDADRELMRELIKQSAGLVLTLDDKLNADKAKAELSGTPAPETETKAQVLQVPQAHSERVSKPSPKFDPEPAAPVEIVMTDAAWNVVSLLAASGPVSMKLAAQYIRGPKLLENAVASLRKSGLVSLGYRDSGPIGLNENDVLILTPLGREKAPPADEVLSRMGKLLPKTAGDMLRELKSAAGGMTAIELADRLAMRSTGGAWSANKRHLRELKLIELKKGRLFAK